MDRPAATSQNKRDGLGDAGVILDRRNAQPSFLLGEPIGFTFQLRVGLRWFALVNLILSLPPLAFVGYVP